MTTAEYRAFCAWARAEIRRADQESQDLMNQPEYAAGERSTSLEVGVRDGRGETLLDVMTHLRDQCVDREQLALERECPCGGQLLSEIEKIEFAEHSCDS